MSDRRFVYVDVCVGIDDELVYDSFVTCVVIILRDVVPVPRWIRISDC